MKPTLKRLDFDIARAYTMVEWWEENHHWAETHYCWEQAFNDINELTSLIRKLVTVIEGNKKWLPDQN